MITVDEELINIKVKVCFTIFNSPAANKRFQLDLEYIENLLIGFDS